ncbi:hypothetical protein E4U42_007888 [Claviceps africana]|uniref:Uncharacterized protein n=1 Tax=Claviceps africana TaxID=83212 RepID=A0A8K0J0V6_9HYPO|nr:hypothetical protein E4U42_007888 [Claviceps africana]
MNPRPPSPGSEDASSPPDEEDGPAAEGGGEIPVLTSITPAMYVPIPADFLTGFTAPTTREEYLQASISTINAHASAVKANIMALTKRECVRIAREADAAWERDRGPVLERRVLRAEDRRAMVANLEAPRGMAAGRELAGTPNFEAWPGAGWAGWKEAKVMGVVSRTMIEVSGYERHVGLVRGGYEEMLRRERRRVSVQARGVGGGGGGDEDGGRAAGGMEVD